VALTRVLAIPGSLRKGSYNRAVLQAAATLAPEGMEIEIHGLDGIPVFNADDEKATGFPPAVASLRAALAEADALLIATPEYNHSVPGALKNALDWLSRSPDSPLTGKPGAILGAAGRFGSVRAQSHLREILLHSRMDLVLAPQVMIEIGPTGFDDDLRLLDERHQDQISRLLTGLAHLVDRTR